MSKKRKTSEMADNLKIENNPFPISEFACRICLDGKPSNITSLFDVVPGVSRSIHEMILFCTEISIFENDGFPQFICGICLSKINISHEIKIKTQESHERLRLLTLGVKQENNMEPLDFLESTVDIQHDDKLFLKEEMSSKSDDDFRMNDFEDRFTSSEEEEKPSKKSVASKQKTKPIKPRKPRSLKAGSSKDLEKFSCDFCKGFEIAGKNQFNRHIREHKARKDKGPHNCSTCKGDYFTVDQLFKHVCSVKKKCYLCNLEMAPGPLSIHLRKDHKGIALLECPECRAILKTATSLHFHIRGHFEVSENICDLCGLTFDAPFYLRKHRMGHSNARPYTCDRDGKTFKKRQHMLKHMRSVHLKEWFDCPECSAKFSKKDILQYHRIRNHGLEAAMRCSICNKGFLFLYQLKLHVKEAHHGSSSDVLSYRCEICMQFFSSQTNYRRHRKLHDKPLLKTVAPTSIVNPSNVPDFSGFGLLPPA